MIDTTLYTEYKNNPTGLSQSDCLAVMSETESADSKVDDTNKLSLYNVVDLIDYEISWVLLGWVLYTIILSIGLLSINSSLEAFLIDQVEIPPKYLSIAIIFVAWISPVIILLVYQFIIYSIIIINLFGIIIEIFGLIIFYLFEILIIIYISIVSINNIDSKILFEPKISIEGMLENILFLYLLSNLFLLCQFILIESYMNDKSDKSSRSNKHLDSSDYLIASLGNISAVITLLIVLTIMVETYYSKTDGNIFSSVDVTELIIYLSIKSFIMIIIYFILNVMLNKLISFNLTNLVNTIFEKYTEKINVSLAILISELIYLFIMILNFDLIKRPLVASEICFYGKCDSNFIYFDFLINSVYQIEYKHPITAQLIIYCVGISFGIFLILKNLTNYNLINFNGVVMYLLVLVSTTILLFTPWGYINLYIIYTGIFLSMLIVLDTLRSWFKESFIIARITNKIRVISEIINQNVSTIDSKQLGLWPGRCFFVFVHFGIPIYSIFASRKISYTNIPILLLIFNVIIIVMVMLMILTLVINLLIIVLDARPHSRYRNKSISEAIQFSDLITLLKQLTNNSNINDILDGDNIFVNDGGNMMMAILGFPIISITIITGVRFDLLNTFMVGHMIVVTICYLLYHNDWFFKLLVRSLISFTSAVNLFYIIIVSVYIIINLYIFGSGEILKINIAIELQSSIGEVNNQFSNILPSISQPVVPQIYSPYPITTKDSNLFILEIFRHYFSVIRILNWKYIIEVFLLCMTLDLLTIVPILRTFKERAWDLNISIISILLCVDILYKFPISHQITSTFNYSVILLSILTIHMFYNIFIRIKNYTITRHSDDLIELYIEARDAINHYDIYHCIHYTDSNSSSLAITLHNMGIDTDNYDIKEKELGPKYYNRRACVIELVKKPNSDNRSIQ